MSLRPRFLQIPCSACIDRASYSVSGSGSGSGSGTGSGSGSSDLAASRSMAWGTETLPPASDGKDCSWTSSSQSRRGSGCGCGCGCGSECLGRSTAVLAGLIHFRASVPTYPTRISPATHSPYFVSDVFEERKQQAGGRGFLYRIALPVVPRQARPPPPTHPVNNDISLAS